MEVKLTDVTVEAGGSRSELVIDASDIPLKPGEWPDELVLVSELSKLKFIKTGLGLDWEVS